MPRSTSLFVRVFLLVVCAVGIAAGAGAQDPGAQVLDVFTRRCADCHGSKAEPKKRAKSLKRLNTIDDLAKLRQNLAADGTAYKKKVVDVSNRKNSELLSHTVGSEADMPQDDAGEYVALPAEEQAIVQAWFDKGMPLVGEQPTGGEAKPSQPAAPRPAFVDEQVWIQAILADLKSLSAADQKQARYFTMGHLYNAGVGEAGLVMQRRGLTKLLNSLSWNPRLAELTLLGPGKAIARVSLRDLDWDDAKWERILAVQNNYFVRQGLDEEKEIARLTGTRMAYVRSDWFVFQAAQPPLYHDLLAPRTAPQALETDLALEQYLGVDVAANIANFQVARAGFEGGKTPGGSGVSDNNRMLERHAITKWDGAYWKSYDFAANAGEKSIFERPFGPKALPHWTEATRQRSFVQDGGEIIWNLPNGMQGYLLVDAKGHRIDKGPPEIVKDRAESGGLGTFIVNGISCMACHAQGMKRQADRVRARIEQLTPTTFTRGERQMAQKLFPEAAAWTTLLDRDEARYADAAKKLGVYGLDAYQREPVLAVFQTFRDELLKFDEAAFELGLSPEQLKGQLGGDLAPLRVELEDKGVPRDRFLDKFRAIARALRIELLDERQELLPDPLVDQHEDADNRREADTQVVGTGGAAGLYGKRGGGPRSDVPASVIAASRHALGWLARHQDEDGKWDCDSFMKHDNDGEVCDGAGNALHDVGVTGLALLAFLGDNNTLRAGPYKHVVKRAVEWLRDQQQENGLFGTSTAHDFIYDHAIATYAMCEAFGLSDDTLLRPVAQRAIDYLESHRNRYLVWRYQPQDSDNDTSVTGWCIMAYKSGEFFGLKINETALLLAASWLDLVSDPTGSHGYGQRGEKSSRKVGEQMTRFPSHKGEAMTAVGLFCRFFMGQDPKEKAVMKAAADLILSKKPVWDEKGGAIDSYYWYYGTYALFQMGGHHWEEWRKSLDKAVVETQESDKSKQNLFGSWSPDNDCWGEDGGRVYTTAILALTLQAYNRYTRLLR